SRFLAGGTDGSRWSSAIARTGPFWAQGEDASPPGPWRGAPRRAARARGKTAPPPRLSRRIVRLAGLLRAARRRGLVGLFLRPCPADHGRDAGRLRSRGGGSGPGRL